MALSTGILSAGFAFHIGIDKWLLYGLFGLVSTLAVYNGQRLFKSEKLEKTPWLLWVKRNERALFLVVIFASLASLMVLLAIHSFRWESFALLGIAGLVSLLYVIKIGGRNMREIPYLKIHLIALSWTLVLIVFPVLNEGVETSVLWMALAHYCYVLAVTIPFDIRDLKYDLKSQRTIPQFLGVGLSKVLSIALLFLFIALMLWADDSLLYNWLFYTSVLAQLLLVLGMNETRSDIYCAGWIDGAIALLGLSYFL